MIMNSRVASAAVAAIFLLSLLALTSCCRMVLTDHPHCRDPRTGKFVVCSDARVVPALLKERSK